MAKSRAQIVSIFLCISAACFPAAAQLQSILDQAGTTQSSENTTKETPNLKAQLLKWKVEAEANLERIEGLAESGELPEGINPSDLSQRRRIYEQTLLAVARHLIILDDAEIPNKAFESLKSESDAWKGFDIPPPYSVLMVDELIEKKEAVEGVQASNRSSAEVFKTTLDGLLKEAKAMDEEIAVLSKADRNDPTNPWKLETARARQRSYFIRASSLKHALSSLEAMISNGAFEIAFLNRKIRDAGDHLTLSKSDLDRVKSASADRQTALRKELADVRKRQQKKQSEKISASAGLAKIKDKPETTPEALELAELTAETAALEADSLQAVSDFLDSFSQIEALVPESYEHRFELLAQDSSQPQKEVITALEAMLRQLDAWDVVARNELASVAADIGKQQARLSLVSAEDPKLALLSRQRAVLWEKQSLVQRAHQSIVNQRRTLSRWLADYQAKESAPWYAPIKRAFSNALDTGKRIWSIPVNRYEETIEIDGQEVTQVRFVSLGSIITAVLLFIIAYFIAAMISRRVQRIMVGRQLIGENQARTLRTWLMLIVALLLAFATLNWLSIPLTIFAFLAGALAIGVGFGTQTIIKNFISGIILLFERKVRVGDIIEVDGINGVVSEINTRSSIVRGANGIENLIPNSLLLENRVVNWTLSNRLLRRELIVRVALGSPSEKVMGILGEVSERHGLILKTPAPFAALSHFGDNSLDFTLFFWIELNDRTNGLMVDSDLRLMIEKRFEDCGIHTGITRAQPADASSRRGELAQQDSGKPVIP